MATVAIKLWSKLSAAPAKFFWRAPRAALLKATRNSDARLAQLTAGKSVAIVGNAQSLLATTQGTEIEDNDVVIRLNKGVPSVPVAQGLRTDIVSLTPELTEQDVMDGFDPTAMLLLTPKLRHLQIKSWANTKKVLFYPYRFWLADRNLIGRRPSSGFMAISYILRAGKADHITLYGFDFGATATYYNPPGYETPHDFAKEAVIVRAWAERGRLTIVPPKGET